MRVRGAVLLLLMLLSTPAPLAAGYRFDVWTADSGLPQNIVSGIRQTNDGYLWIATLDGLARFDGVRFTLFDKQNTPGIRSSRFHSMLEDSEGNFWLRTESGEVTRYRRGQFTTWGAEQGVPTSEMVGFTLDEAGHVLVVSLRGAHAVLQFAIAHKHDLACGGEPT